MLLSMSTMIVAALAGLLVRAQFSVTPLGLLAVNVSGSFIAGFLGGLKLPGSLWVTAGIVGFCGCLTTFSGYALENVKLFEQGDFFKIGINFILHNALCLFVCYVGWLMAHKI